MIDSTLAGVLPGNLVTALEWVHAASGYLQRSDLPGELEQPDPTPASVLIPLFKNQGEWHVLFIRRVANERDHHSGQVAFPGGRADPIDTDPVATALREAHEEIGLETGVTKVIHVLPQYLTSSSYIVTPVISIVPWPYPYKAQPSEVGRIFSIPLSWLADQRNVELRDKYVSRDNFQATLKVVYYQPFDSEVLWGASARMTISLLQSLYAGDFRLNKE